MIQFDPGSLLSEPFPVPPHAILAIVALGIGAVQLFARKGTTQHRLLGYVWTGCMAFVALTSLFIHEIRVMGPFSPIHLLSLFVLVALLVSIRAARRNNLERHRKGMVYMYVLGLLLTGAFTLLPGRAMHTVFFGS
ncbi:hypothetical protein AB838_03720 [Rhodobacteraceae bacterium (ex Bugula neritina AB1)]|nr:hypothetical protein AB838_03720 [Rhodobacteraceae bacterium (ex Bugula neritina AB1)]